MALQLLTVLLETPTDDSVEIAVNFTKEVGQLLDQVSPQGAKPAHIVENIYERILYPERSSKKTGTVARVFPRAGRRDTRVKYEKRDPVCTT